jgi:hypothetical protein
MASAREVRVDRCRPLGVKRSERGQIGAALIQGNRFGLTVLVNRLLEAAARSSLVRWARNRKSTVLLRLSMARYRYFHCSSVRRWVIKLVPLFEKAFRRHKRAVGKSWRMDETYVKVKVATAVKVLLFR